jgi:hypothetical protein
MGRSGAFRPAKGLIVLFPDCLCREDDLKIAPVHGKARSIKRRRQLGNGIGAPGGRFYSAKAQGFNCLESRLSVMHRIAAG